MKIPFPTCSVRPNVPRTTGEPRRSSFAIPAPRPTSAPVRPMLLQRSTGRPFQEPPETDDLYDYQAAGVNFLQNLPSGRGMLSDEMGLGKTVQALRALEKNDRVIVVCPAGLRLNWLYEVKQWRPDLEARIELNPERAGALSPARGEVILVSADNLPPALGKTLLVADNLSDVTVIADEAHYFKNHTAQRTKRFAALSAQAMRVWLLTGTPMLGRPLDLFGVLRSGRLIPQTFGTFDRFVEIFEGSQNKWGAWEFGTKVRGVKKKKLTEKHYLPARKCLEGVMLRRLQEEVDLDLPPLRFTDIHVEITGSHVIEQADHEWELYGADEMPPFTMLSEAMRVLATAKIPHMIAEVERFEEEEKPLLVFSAHLDPIRVLEKRDGWKTITGGQSPKDRDQAVKDFQAGKLKGLGLTISAGGVGLNLTHAAHELFVDADYTPGKNQQAMFRAARIGQKAKSVEVRRLMAKHPLETRLWEILMNKAADIKGVVG